MRKLLPLVLLATACYKTEYSFNLQEPGRIEQVSFEPGATAIGTGSSFDSKGNYIPTTTITTIPDRYGVVVSCMHGKFILRPDGSNAYKVFSKFKTGDSVTITYREVYHVKDGKRELYKLDFLDATSRKVEQ